MITTAETYDDDLRAARALLHDVLMAMIAARADDFDPEGFAVQITESLDDELKNSWIDGLTIAEWAAKAAEKFQIEIRR